MELEKKCEKKCVWYQEDEDFFETSCNRSFNFYEGTPKENAFKFCPFCGKEIEEELMEEEED